MLCHLEYINKTFNSFVHLDYSSLFSCHSQLAPGTQGYFRTCCYHTRQHCIDVTHQSRGGCPRQCTGSATNSQQTTLLTNDVTEFQPLPWKFRQDTHICCYLYITSKYEGLLVLQELRVFYVQVLLHIAGSSCICSALEQ